MPKIIKSVGKNYVELELELEHESEKALLVSNGITTEWVPKSQLEDDPEHLKNGLVRIIVPEWLAVQKGFV